MSDRSIVHDTFTIERTYPAPPARVFAAWADPVAKSRWFGEPGKDNQAEVFEFRPGGREYRTGPLDHGGSYSFDVRYYDIVENQRIVYAYEMHLGGKRISVSVATIELEKAGKGTRMIVTEHGAFLDGLDTNAQREGGTKQLLEQLGTELEKA